MGDFFLHNKRCYDTFSNFCFFSCDNLMPKNIRFVYSRSERNHRYKTLFATLFPLLYSNDRENRWYEYTLTGTRRNSVAKQITRRKFSERLSVSFNSGNRLEVTSHATMPHPSIL
jgi:hypothetical protein